MDNLYDDTRVIELTDNDVDGYKITHPKCNNHYGMVIFYAPWCPHCTTMVRPLNYLANQLEDRGISFGAVNCTKQPKMSQSFEISSFPSLYTLFPGGTLEKYEGKRDIDNLLHWLVKTTNNKTPPKNNIDLDMFTDSDGEYVGSDDDQVDIGAVRKSIVNNILNTDSVDHASLDHASVDHASLDHASLDHASVDHASLDPHLKDEDSQESDKSLGFMDKLHKLLEPPSMEPQMGNDLYHSSIEKTDAMIVGPDKIDLGDCSSKNAIIIAYMPWCIHCKNMVDTVNKLSSNGQCVFTVNCQKQSKFTKLFRIDSFPTILYRRGMGFESGPTTITDLQKYSGPRTLEALTKLLETGDASQIGGAFMCPAISWQLFPCCIM